MMDEDQDDTPHEAEPLPVHEEIRQAHFRGMKAIGIGMFASGAGAALFFWLWVLLQWDLPRQPMLVVSSLGFLGNLIGIPPALVLGYRTFRQPKWEWWWPGIAICVGWGFVATLISFYAGF